MISGAGSLTPRTIEQQHWILGILSDYLMGRTKNLYIPRYVPRYLVHLPKRVGRLVLLIIYCMNILYNCGGGNHLRILSARLIPSFRGLCTS